MNSENNYKSNEEIEFVHWLNEAQEHNLIKKWFYEPVNFLLSSGFEEIEHVLIGKRVKEKKKIIIRKMEYTPDFMIILDEGQYEFFKRLGFYHNSIESLIKKDIFPTLFSPWIHDFVMFIEVKGLVIPGVIPAANNISSATYPIKRAWMWELYHIVINLVVARDTVSRGIIKKPGFFRRTFVPKEVAWMLNRKVPTRRKAFQDCKFINEVINEN